jgi:uncharacterized protein
MKKTDRDRRAAHKRPALLDVNFLIALMDPEHEFHAAAHVWFQQQRHFGWATCPITENGCLRILSRPGYPVQGLTATRVRDMMTEFVGLEGHRFWPDSVSILEPDRFDLQSARSNAITDLYLLSLAVANRGRLVTFDQRIHWEWVRGSAPGNLEIVAPLSH